MTRPCDKWDRRFLELALLVRTWSKDPSTQHATIIVETNTRRVVSVGYNGFPRPMSDKVEYYDNRDEKYSRVIHGEMNAILQAQEPVHGMTAYVVSGVGCERCVVHMIQAGIKRYVFMNGDAYYQERWGEAAERSLGYLEECGCSYQIIDTNTWEITREYIG